MRLATVAVVLSGLVLVTAAAQASALPDEEAADNGLVYMVHGHFEPAVTEDVPPPPAHEAFATTQQEGQIVLYVIPYSVDEQAPTPFSDDTIVALSGPLPGQTLLLEPREGTQDDDRCVDETSIPGHEGDVSDCLVVEAPAEEVRGWTALGIELRGTMVETGEHVTEAYSSAAHVAMHTTMEDGEPGWETADQLSGLATPFLVEDLVDPVP